MNDRVVRFVSGILLVVPLSFAVHAQCSPGTILYYTPTNAYCGPDPNYNSTQQQARPTSEVWQDRYGVIAVDTQGGPLGFSTDMRSRSAANEAAMDDCRAKGNTSCVLKSSYVNGCTALVTDSAGYSFTTKETQQEAIDDALQMCAAAKGKNCRLYYQGCSLPVRVR